MRKKAKSGQAKIISRVSRPAKIMSVERYFTSEHGFSHYDKFAEKYGIYACISIFFSELLSNSFRIVLLGKMLTSFLFTVQTVVACSTVYIFYLWLAKHC